MTEHSPTPWKNDGCRIEDASHNPAPVAECCTIRDSAHIVLCVNAHDDLVAALERCIEVLEPQVSLGYMPIGGEDKGNSIHAEQALYEIRVALAKAKAEGIHIGGTSDLDADNLFREDEEPGGAR